ncbi:C99L2 protein, partial [Picathartes gymnocephalus]|nr:C99L2 protein [Picathartes gymnocephalus]
DTFDDSDLIDANLPRGGSDGSGSNGKIAGYNTSLAWLSILKYVYKHLWFFSASQGAIAGIVSAVAATVIGAVSSFIAYQKKKLCFKQSGKKS